MQITLIAGMLAAFLLGAYVRKPFAIARKKKINAAEHKPTAQEIELQNIMNYGLPGYRQQEAEYED